MLCMASRDEEWNPTVLWREKSSTFYKRRALTEQCPVSAARYYDRLMRSVFMFLFGVNVDSKKETLEQDGPGNIIGDGHGMYGYVRAVFNATEAQGITTTV